MSKEWGTEARSRTGLLVVDVQPDFLPGGALGVAGGDEILDGVARLMNSGRFGTVVATQDWHPRGHISFAGSHPGRRPFETILLYGRDQTLWPDHCVQNTAGAELARGLPWERVAAVVRKGIDPMVDSYSGIRNNWDARGERSATGLAGYLRDRGIVEVCLCGLARDYCVKWTAEDTVAEGFRASVYWDLTRPVVPSSDDAVRRDLHARGVKLLFGDPP